MDIPWLVLGVVLGVGLVLLAGLVAALVLHGRPRSEPDPAPGDFRDDDLPGFLESPPGAAATPSRPGWAVLAAAAAPAPPPRRRRDTLVVLAAMAATALLLVGAAAAAASRSDVRPAAASPASASSATDARLTFAGVVLEPRAVGVTASYPVVDLTSDGGRSRARVRLPTFNCLTGEAPADPVAAGCTPTLTEYAVLASPALEVADDGDRLVVRGLFPTETRPNGGPPVPTGRSYQLRISVTPAGPPGEDGWRPARGVLELGPGRAATVDVSVLRSGS